MSTRAERLMFHRAAIGYPAAAGDAVLGLTDDHDGISGPIMLVEKDTAGDDTPCFTTHPTVEEAVKYHLSQEHADCWRITHLIDVDTETYYRVETTDETFVATTGCVTQTTRHIITPSTGAPA